MQSVRDNVIGRHFTLNFIQAFRHVVCTADTGIFTLNFIQAHEELSVFFIKRAKRALLIVRFLCVVLINSC